MYWLAKSREWKGCDLDQLKSIKVEDGRVLVEEVHIKRRYHTYFHGLLNREGDRDIVLAKLKHL